MKKQENYKWTPRLFVDTVGLKEYKDMISAHITWRCLDMAELGVNEKEALSLLIERVKKLELSLGNSSAWSIDNIHCLILEEKNLY